MPARVTLNPAVDQADLDEYEATVGNWTVWGYFVDYMKSIGAFPGAPSNSTAPGPVTSLTGSVSGNNVTLSWANPADADFASLRVRRAAGAAAPATIADGTKVDVAHAATSLTDRDLSPSTTYSYAIWARDYAGNYSTRATVTVTTTA